MSAHVRPAHAVPDLGEDLVGGTGDAVDPVVEEGNSFVVVSEGLLGVLEDQGCVQAPAELDADVRGGKK